MPQFTGFTADLYRFLDDLALNNNKEWFHANKSRYEEAVKEPLLDFITSMIKPLANISTSYIAEPKVNGGSMFRIHRDVRFSKDKRPYKEHAACQFRHYAGKDAHAPGFYVHLGRDAVVFGGGVWLPASEPLYNIRQAIQDKPDEWKKLTQSKLIKNHFGAIDGEQLTRPPRGFDKDHPQIEDIKRKSFFAMRREDPKFALRDDFLDQVVETFKAAAPLNAFICRSLGVNP